MLSSLNEIKKPNNNGNNFIIKSPKLMSIIVENILKLLYLRDFTISELLVELQKRWPYSSPPPPPHLVNYLKNILYI